MIFFFFFLDEMSEKLRKGHWTSLLYTQFISQLMHCAHTVHARTYSHTTCVPHPHQRYCACSLLVVLLLMFAAHLCSALLCHYLCGFPSRSDRSAKILKEPNSTQIHYQQTLSNLFTFVKFGQLCTSSVAHLLVRIFFSPPQSFFVYIHCSISTVGEKFN